MGTGSFLVVKRPGRGADHPPPSSAEVKKEYSYTSTPSGPSGLLRGTFTFVSTLQKYLGESASMLRSIPLWIEILCCR
jgi:hypothetical protein